MNQPPQTEVEARAYSEAEYLTESEYHSLMASSRRRAAMDVLATADSPIALEALAARVAEQEYGDDVAEQEAIDLATLHLHHADLPKMAALGVIDYDPETARIVAF